MAVYKSENHNFLSKKEKYEIVYEQQQKKIAWAVREIEFIMAENTLFSPALAASTFRNQSRGKKIDAKTWSIVERELGIKSAEKKSRLNIQRSMHSRKSAERKEKSSPECKPERQLTLF